MRDVQTILRHVEFVLSMGERGRLVVMMDAQAEQEEKKEFAQSMGQRRRLANTRDAQTMVRREEFVSSMVR